MKNLILIRHAKSNWDAPLKDIERPLDRRGITDAHLVASNCISFLPHLFIIYCSLAKRASETALIFSQNISYPVENIVYKDELYTFDFKQLQKTIRKFNNNYDNVILFGHNEAITNFVNKFGDVFIDNVPTSGFVFLQFDANSWDAIDKAKTIKSLFPKDLK